MKITDWLSVMGTIFTGLAAIAAVLVYWRNSKLERAKWLASLYEKFYEKDHLKPVREILDCDEDISLEITKLIRDEPAEFTDYLNFFEFVAFLRVGNQLHFREIEQLFGYYLHCMGRRKDIRDYIKRKDYQLLERLLDEYRQKKK